MKTLEVSVTDKRGNQHATVRLPEERLNAYIAKHEKARTWGKPERWVSGDMLTDDEKAANLEQREGEFGAEYKLAAEFTVVVTDVTDAIAEADAAEAEKKAKREAARARVIEITDKKPPSMEEMREALRILIDEGIL